jgi:hypothetical protein
MRYAAPQAAAGSDPTIRLWRRSYISYKALPIFHLLQGEADPTFIIFSYKAKPNLHLSLFLHISLRHRIGIHNMAIEIAPTGTGFILSQVNSIEIHPAPVPGSNIGVDLS